MKKKIPCIECNYKLWEYIKPYLKKWGYNIVNPIKWDIYPVLVIDYTWNLGEVSNLSFNSLTSERELITNVEEFLQKAAELKGFTYKRKDMSNFTKENLKPGMVVENRKGNRYLVCEFNENINFISEEYWNPASGFNEDLTCVGNDEFDIMKVYNSNCVLGLIPLLSNHGNSLCLIWERQEPKEITITMDEIAKKFGYPVEAIKIKK